MRTLICGLIAAVIMRADTGYEAWLRYAPVQGSEASRSLPAAIFVAGNSPLLASAQQELLTGVRGMLGRTLRIERTLPNESAILLGTLDSIRSAAPGLALPAALANDGYLLRTVTSKGVRHIAIAGANDRGALYGAFALLRKISLKQSIAALDEAQSPYAPVRWVNEWNNLDGTIERGYGGRSIFFDKGAVREDLSRVRDYARMLASIGINGCAINNVNANPLVLTPEFLPQLVRIANVFRPWGVKLVLSVDFGSPKRTGGLGSFDPLLPEVAAWWKAKVDEIYAAIPDLAGFVMKADSEGRVGPSAYGRTHADAANTVARALKPHGGLIFYRGFVYDHHADWTNLKNDRARAAYDNFKPLDGKFDDNVVIQIKNGPIDFQVREPVSPLFAALEKTNKAVELQITQEYFGQARHLVFLVPYWKDALGASTPVRGFVGVSNVGLDANWMGNHLSQANLYGFGRLAWNPDLSSERIVDEWTRLTFGHDAKLVDALNRMQLKSWRVYENYTGPHGLQTLTAITGTHFGAAVEASERNGWGQWHRSDEHGSGMDRTAATGTGFIAQYPPRKARIFESLETCPDDLVLFMHHVPYTHVLHSGKTVIQSIYDKHYEGAAAAAGYVNEWRSLEGRVDRQRFQEVLAQLTYQSGHAEEWRDAVNTWFLKTSGIADKQGRAGHFPGRVEAESMKLEGYSIKDVTPWEAASGGKAIECAVKQCAASFRYDGPAGWYTFNVRYFDQSDGVSRFRLSVAGQNVSEWRADDLLPSRRVDSASSTRRLITGIALRTGDEVRIEGFPDGRETAALDYVEVNLKTGISSRLP
jgi:alpha-glucuronidase